MVNKLDALETENEKLREETVLLRGITQVQDKKISQHYEKIVDLTARSMANNVIITSLEGDVKNEQCKKNVLEFLREKVKMDVLDDEVEVAHRLGIKEEGKIRDMIVRCHFKLRDRIFGYTKNLKGLTNTQRQPYYVRSQLPEPRATQKKEREFKIKEVKKQNAEIPENEKEKRVEIKVKGQMLYLNKVPQKQHITAPTVQDIFNIDRVTEQKINSLKGVYTSEISEKSSKFVGHAFKVHTPTDVRLAYRKVRLLFPESDNIPMAYKVKEYSGYHDDREHGAGCKIGKNPNRKRFKGRGRIHHKRLWGNSLGCETLFAHRKIGEGCTR